MGLSEVGNVVVGARVEVEGEAVGSVGVKVGWFDGLLEGNKVGISVG